MPRIRAAALIFLNFAMSKIGQRAAATLVMRICWGCSSIDLHQRPGAKTDDGAYLTAAGGIMGRVLFQCRKTRKEFDSGFQAGAADMDAVPLAATIRLRCPICAEMHEFKFADARIEEKSAARRR
jgi:hypothetical protein